MILLKFEDWIKRSLKMMDKEESSELFAINNKDGDNYVTWEEYKSNDLKDLEDEGLSELEKLEALSMLEEDKVLFLVSYFK